MTLAKMREATSVEVGKLRSKRNNADPLYHELLASIRRVVKAREVRKNIAVDTLVKLCNFYGDGRKVTLEVHFAEWGDYWERVSSLTSTKTWICKLCRAW